MPSAQPLTSEFGFRWRAIGGRTWAIPYVLIPLWVFAVAIAIFFDTGQCTPADPAHCGPDTGFAFWIVIALATPILLWWMPLAGCAFGIAFALADIAYDPVREATVAFGVHGTACAVAGLWLLHSASRQEQIALTATGGMTSAGPMREGHDDRSGGRGQVRLGAAALLAVVSAVLLGVYLHAVSGENAHLTRAVPVHGLVVAIDEYDYRITLKVPTPHGPLRQVDTEVLDTGPYPEGVTTPMLIDPQDLQWARLVAEPHDATGWLSGAYAALLLALVLVCRERGRRHAYQWLWTGEHPVLRVRILLDDMQDVLVLAADQGQGRSADQPIARVPIRYDDAFEPEHDGDEAHDESDWDESDWDEEDQEAFGRVWRGEEHLDDAEPLSYQPVEAVLLGSLRDRGWVLVVTQGGVLAPSGPMRLERRGSDVGRGWHWKARLPFGPWRDLEDHTARDKGETLPGQPVLASALRVEPDLPLLARSPRHTRAVGALMIAAGMVGAPIVMLWLAEDWWSRLTALGFGGELVVAGTSSLLQRVRLTEQSLEVVTATRAREVPWERLQGIRRDREVLSIACESIGILDVGPFEQAETAGGEDRAEQLAAAMMWLRARSLTAGTRTRQSHSSPGPMWPLLAIYVAVVAASLWLGAQ